MAYPYIRYPDNNKDNYVDIHCLKDEIRVIGDESLIRKELESYLDSPYESESEGAQGVLYMLDHFKRV